MGKNMFKNTGYKDERFIFTETFIRAFNMLIHVMYSKRDLEDAAFPTVWEHRISFGTCHPMGFLWNPCLLSLKIGPDSVFALALPSPSVTHNT